MIVGGFLKSQNPPQSQLNVARVMLFYSGLCTYDVNFPGSGEATTRATETLGAQTNPFGQ